MIPCATLTLIDGVRIVVPDSLNLITPYVIHEQQDWFEDEIKFLRRLLQPEQKVIDVGANYGIYTLTMAQTLGPKGKVWAFEPTSTTAGLLAKGIAANNFAHIVLDRCALSSTSGTGHLSLNDNSESNYLVRAEQPGNATETVSLVTLDECLQRYGWQDIAFVKIDAEGEESNILKGGTQFLAELSPLVQYEINSGEGLNVELVRDFSAHGYNSYRLVPGLDLLIPFDTKSVPDGYMLNLFCCKNDRAAQLAKQGFLLEPAPHLNTVESERHKSISVAANNNPYSWRNTIAKLPYGITLTERWETTMAAGNSAGVDEALVNYAVSQDSALSSAERFNALEISFRLLKSLCEIQPTCLRLASLARVAQDYGARAQAVDALNQLSNIILQHKQVDSSEPFLAPAKRFDLLPPRDIISNWVLAAVLEEFERLSYFSSFYTGASGWKRLEMIGELGYGSAEMKRRTRLIQQRFGMTTSQLHQV